MQTRLFRTCFFCDIKDYTGKAKAQWLYFINLKRNCKEEASGL